MYIWVYVAICVTTCVHVSTCMWMPEVNADCLLQLSLFICLFVCLLACLRQGLSLNLELTNCQACWPEVPEIHCLSGSIVLGLQMYATSSSLLCECRGSKLRSVLLWQALISLRHLHIFEINVCKNYLTKLLTIG